MEIFAYALLIYLLTGLWCTAVSRFKKPDDARALFIIGWLWPVLILLQLFSFVTEWL